MSVRVYIADEPVVAGDEIGFMRKSEIIGAQAHTLRAQRNRIPA